MAAYEVLLLNTAVPQIQAAQSGDTYVVPRDIAFSAVANLANGTYLLPALAFSSDPDTGIFRQGANALGFTAGGGADQMVLTTTGLGIGTSSPTDLLQTSTSANTAKGIRVTNTNSGTSTYASIYFGGATNATDSIIAGLGDGTTGYGGARSMVLGTNQATPVVFITSGTEKMRLDSSGNLGLGVTPSAWPGQSAGYYVSQFGNAAFYGLSTNEARMAANAFVDAIGTNRYISSGYATRHDQKDGVYIWRTAPSGTANSTTIVINNEYTIVTAGGNFTAFGAANNNVGTVFTATSSGTATGGAATQTIVFTQAMTLDASGNLGVGNTSPTSYNSAADNLVIGSSGSNGMTIVSGTTGAGYIMFADGTVGQQAYEGQITYDHASNFMAFNTSGGERARITSGGYFKASDNGTYNNAAGLYHELYQSTVETATVISAVNASFANNILQLNAARNTTNNSFYALSYYNSGAGAYKLRVADSGAIGTAGSITLGSITPATSGIGVQFPATQSASSDANTLDDYEEGTFDPEVTFGGGSTSLTYTTKTGFYRKIGSLVFFSFRIVLSAKGSSTGLAKISIPFPAANIGRPGGANLMYGVDFTTVTAAETTIDTDQNASIASLYTITAGAALTDANFQNTTDFIAAFCYISA